MSRTFNGTSGNHLNVETPVVTAPPFTLFGWFYSTSSNTDQTILCVGGQNSTFTEDRQLRLVSALGSVGYLIAQSRQGSTQAYAQTAAAPSINTWNSACGVFSANNSRAVYLNGGSKGTNTSTVTVTTTDLKRTAVGLSRSLGNSAGMTGQVAHPAIWNAALTDEEVAMLAAGLSPLRVRPQSLVFYQPYLGRDSPEIDIAGGRALTVTGAAASANEPPFIWPKARRRTFRAPDPISVTIDAGALTLAGSAATFAANESVETSGQLQVTGSTATADTETVAGAAAAEIAGQALTLAMSTPAAEPASGGGGRARPVRYWIELYGRMVYVETPEEGVRLLREAQAEAQREAQREAEDVVARRSPAVRSLGRVKPVSLTPTVRTNLPETDPVREARADIRRIYDEAARAATARLERERAQWLQDHEDGQVLIALGDL